MSSGSNPPAVAVLGAGLVAVTLAGALRRGGADVVGLWARRPEAARAAAEAAGVPVLPSLLGVPAVPAPEALARAAVVILAVRDDAIAEFGAELARAGVLSRHQTLLHCSGSRAAEAALGHVRRYVDGLGTLHPLRAIADGPAAMRTLAGTVFGVEGDERGRAVAERLARDYLAGRPLVLDSGQMSAYHAAAAIVANYVVALVDAASDVLARAGVGPADAVAALVPLARGSLDNLEAHGPARGLTGPIRRGDRDTVAKHLAVLADDPALGDLYRGLGRRALALARACGDAAEGDLDAIEALLAPGEGNAEPGTLPPRSEVDASGAGRVGAQTPDRTGPAGRK